MDPADIAGNLGSERRHIGLKIGIVGALQGGRPHPPIPFASDDEDEGADQNEDKQPDACAGPSGCPPCRDPAARFVRRGISRYIRLLASLLVAHGTFTS